MSAPLSVMICAGEPSGDVLGAQLIAALRIVSPRPLMFSGLGGPLMEREGLVSQFPISDLAVMGFSDVVPKIPVLLRRIRETARFAARTKPDVLVLVDAPSFAHRVATQVKKLAPEIPIVIYVAPQVWAWRPGRARHMPGYVDHVLALLPFEPAFFETYGVHTTHVGHPVVERLQNPGQGPAFRSRHGIEPRAPLLAVLLGSRRKEISRLAPVFGEAVALLAQKTPGLSLVVPTIPQVEGLARDAVKDWPVRAVVTADFAEKFEAFEAADVALAASGTVSLEIALARTPTVIAYKVDALSAAIARRLIKVRYANIINLILDREALPELIQQNCTGEKIAGALEHLFTDETARTAQRVAFDTAMRALGQGEESPSLRAARAVLASVRAEKSAP